PRTRAFGSNATIITDRHNPLSAAPFRSYCRKFSSGVCAIPITRPAGRIRRRILMKRSTVFLFALVLTVLFLSASAMMQQDNTPQSVSPAAPDSYVSDSPLHKVILDAADQATYNRLSEQSAIHDEINYGSFRMLVVDERAMGGRMAMQSLGGAVQDNFNLIALNGYVLDTTNPAATYNQLPADLRKSDIAIASAAGSAPAGGLYLVQFVGPIQDEWLKALRTTGAEIVSYMPFNAYVVRG